MCLNFEVKGNHYLSVITLLIWDDVQLIYEANELVNPLNANPIKWSDTLRKFVGKLPMNCLSVFDHFVELMVKGLTGITNIEYKHNCLIFLRGRCCMFLRGSNSTASSF